MIRCLLHNHTYEFGLSYYSLADVLLCFLHVCSSLFLFSFLFVSTECNVIVDIYVCAVFFFLSTSGQKDRHSKIGIIALASTDDNDMVGDFSVGLSENMECSHSVFLVIFILICCTYRGLA